MLRETHWTHRNGIKLWKRHRGFPPLTTKCSNVMMSVCMKRPKTVTQSFSNFKAASLESVCVHAGSLGVRLFIRPGGLSYKTLERNGWQTEKFEVRVQKSAAAAAAQKSPSSLEPDAVSGSGSRLSSGQRCRTPLLSVITQRSVPPEEFLCLPKCSFRCTCLSTAGNHPQLFFFQSWGLISAEMLLLPHIPSQCRNILTAKMEIFSVFRKCLVVIHR